MSAAGEVRVRFRVVGRVQGVGFRWWAARQARALDLAGTVQNEPDGSVAVEAEGSAVDVSQFRALLEEGPPYAEVERVEILPASRERLPNPFAIRA